MTTSKHTAGGGAEMRSAVEVKTDRKLGEISPYIYGQYFEHLEDCIYPSVWDDRSPHADEFGLRKDVIREAAELAVPVVRWPGGCFADLYHWEDGIGPAADRPVRRNWHWGGTESNRFGTDEFLRWCELVGAEPYINFNLGTGTLDEALRWMDYCNGAEPTKDVLARRANGREEPYNVKFWGIGNETWGTWEAGRMNAETYAWTLANWCEFVRKAQPDARILAVGSSDANDPDWDRKVLEAAGTYIDYLTLHTYAWSLDRATGAEYYPVVFTADYMRERMRKMIRVIQEASGQSRRPIRIAVDEWNIRHYVKDDSTGKERLFRRSPRTLQDAVFAAGVLNAMIRLSPHVGMANYVFLVNGNGVMNVDGDTIVRTPLYHIFQQYGRWMRGDAVETVVHGPKREAPAPQIHHPGCPVPEDYTLAEVAYLDAAASLSGDRLAVSLVNRHQSEPITAELTVPESFELASAWTLYHDDIYASNDTAAPERVVPVLSAADAGAREWECPPHSVVLLSFRRKPSRQAGDQP